MCYLTGNFAYIEHKSIFHLSVLNQISIQLYLLQLDFQLPSRFNLTYSAEDESSVERPVIIHRAILGSVERMLSILIENYKGKWPLWLSPRQAIVCSVSEKSQAYAVQVLFILLCFSVLLFTCNFSVSVLSNLGVP